MHGKDEDVHEKHLNKLQIYFESTTPKVSSRTTTATLCRGRLSTQPTPQSSIESHRALHQ